MINETAEKNMTYYTDDEIRTIREHALIAIIDGKKAEKDSDAEKTVYDRQDRQDFDNRAFSLGAESNDRQNRHENKNDSDVVKIISKDRISSMRFSAINGIIPAFFNLEIAYAENDADIIFRDEQSMIFAARIIYCDTEMVFIREYRKGQFFPSDQLFFADCIASSLWHRFLGRKRINGNVQHEMVRKIKALPLRNCVFNKNVRTIGDYLLPNAVYLKKDYFLFGNDNEKKQLEKQLFFTLGFVGSVIHNLGGESIIFVFTNREFSGDRLAAYLMRTAVGDLDYCNIKKLDSSLKLLATENVFQYTKKPNEQYFNDIVKHIINNYNDVFAYTFDKSYCINSENIPFESNDLLKRHVLFLNENLEFSEEEAQQYFIRNNLGTNYLNDFNNYLLVSFSHDGDRIKTKFEALLKKHHESDFSQITTTEMRPIMAKRAAYMEFTAELLNERYGINLNSEGIANTFLNIFSFEENSTSITAVRIIKIIFDELQKEYNTNNSGEKNYIINENYVAVEYKNIKNILTTNFGGNYHDYLRILDYAQYLVYGKRNANKCGVPRYDCQVTKAVGFVSIRFVKEKVNDFLF